ncbi:hypothetical protein PIROE2DRAFT_59500 [Piromyces sp. E2]|nr:hypothetical protein PIROE2DRAFT_59500 [Piromyces sp. E2]|eukprot:OUM66238.1 hypothetical protein PIROE2DRAFT_59500 [Piromyces sp. E2]
MSKYAFIFKVVIFSIYLHNHAIAQDSEPTLTLDNNRLLNECRNEIQPFISNCNFDAQNQSNYEEEVHIDTCNQFEIYNCTEVFKSPASFISPQCEKYSQFFLEYEAIQANYFCAKKNTGEFCINSIDLIIKDLYDIPDVDSILKENCLHEDCRVHLLEHLKHMKYLNSYDKNFTDDKNEIYEKAISYLENKECFEENDPEPTSIPGDDSLIETCRNEIRPFMSNCNFDAQNQSNYEEEVHIDTCTQFEIYNCTEVFKSPASFISPQCEKYSQFFLEYEAIQASYFCAKKNTGEFCINSIDLIIKDLYDIPDVDSILKENCLHEDCRVHLLEHLKHMKYLNSYDKNFTANKNEIYEKAISYLENEECK